MYPVWILAEFCAATNPSIANDPVVALVGIVGETFVRIVVAPYLTLTVTVLLAAELFRYVPLRVNLNALFVPRVFAGTEYV